MSKQEYPNAVEVSVIFHEGRKMFAVPKHTLPDAIHHTDTSETLEYITGWNDCRAAMLAEQPAPVPCSQTILKLALEALQEVYWSSRSAKHDEAITALEALAEPEFFTHCVDQPYDWSEWVCPDPKSYLFKCCDCGLVHEAEFGVVRYKSETEREDCDMVDDPNLQAVFRMRRSEQWSPVDTAHRAGGLHMEQPAQRIWVGLTDQEIEQGCKESWVTEQAWQSAVWWAEAKLKEKNT